MKEGGWVVWNITFLKNSFEGSVSYLNTETYKSKDENQWYLLERLTEIQVSKKSIIIIRFLMILQFKWLSKRYVCFIKLIIRTCMIITSKLHGLLSVDFGASLWWSWQIIRRWRVRLLVHLKVAHHRNRSVRLWFKLDILGKSLLVCNIRVFNFIRAVGSKLHHKTEDKKSVKKKIIEAKWYYRNFLCLWTPKHTWQKQGIFVCTSMSEKTTSRIEKIPQFFLLKTRSWILSLPGLDLQE